MRMYFNSNMLSITTCSHLSCQSIKITAVFEILQTNDVNFGQIKLRTQLTVGANCMYLLDGEKGNLAQERYFLDSIRLMHCTERTNKEETAISTEHTVLALQLAYAAG